MHKSDPPPVAVVIPAAGTGTRLGGPRKQFRTLGGKPLLVQTVLVFERHPAVGTIILVAPAESLGSVRSMCHDYNLSKVEKVVAGGATRQASVQAGLAALDPATEIILTHDGVRPFVSGQDITRLVESLQTNAAAVLSATISDTLCRSSGEMVTERVDRDGVFRLLTPQAFRADILTQAHKKAMTEGGKFTDEVTLVTSAGESVKLIPCTSPNIKITTPLDWEQALWMWPKWEETLQEQD